MFVDKKYFLPVMISLSLTACFNSTDDDGNPNKGKVSVNLTTSKAGTSGGFVDVDADGKVDAIVGAPEAMGSTEKTGAAMIYLDYENNQANEASAYLTGEAKGDFFGFSYANLGDVNADGKADFVVGAINAEGEAGISGAAYVYKGGENPPQLLAKLKGERTFAKFGYALAGGDVNGDGENDVIVTAPHTFHDEFQSGGVYVYFGGSKFDDVADVVITGDKVNATMGMAIASGDVNGDAIDDIIVDAGAKVYIYYGGSDIKSRIEADPTPNVKIRSDSGGHGGSGFGYALAVAGDINGDGFNDVAVGNQRRSSPSFYDNAGSLYVFKGGDNLPDEFFEDNVDYRIVKIVGAGFDEQLGYSIAAIGDFDGAGSPDLVVGARWANGGVNGDMLITGNVYLFLGEALNVEDASVDQTVEIAEKVFPQEATSAEQGSFVAVSGHSLLSGMPGANKHTGGVHVTHLHAGSNVVATGNGSSNGSGESDPHAGH